MKNRGTILYVGEQSKLATSLVEENYAVDMIGFGKLMSIAEFTKDLDGKTIEVATDHLEGDCPAIVMDMRFFEGIDVVVARISEIIKAKLKNEISNDENQIQYSNDSISQEIEKKLSAVPGFFESIIKTIKEKELPLEKVDKAIDEFFEKNGNKYIPLIVEKINLRVLLGDRNYEILKNSTETIKKAADERIKDSRISSGDKRDLPKDNLDLDRANDNDRWRPILLLTTNQNAEDVTHSEQVSNEYLKMELIKKILAKFGLQLTVSGIVNTRITQDGHATVDPVKLVKAVRWAEFISNSEQTVNRNVKEFMKDAFEMFDILDVNGGIVNHSLRTAQLMKCLLESMNKGSANIYSGDKVPKSLWKAYIIGALFHDNGKLLNISRPDLPNFLPTLQTNASRLPAEGFAAVRSHAEIGGDNIKSIIDNQAISGKKSYLEVVASMAYYHQEFFLGEKGYSLDKKHDFNLKEVPLEAQYMAIVDVFDAIVGRRNYNKETDDKGEVKLPTLEDAMEIMAKEAGIVIKTNDPKEKIVQPGQWHMDDKISFERKEGYFLENNDAHFNQNLLMCFFEFLQSEALKYREGKKNVINFKEDKDGRLIIESIAGIGFEQYLHRDSINLSKPKMFNPSKFGKYIQEQWKKGQERRTGGQDR